MTASRRAATTRVLAQALVPGLVLLLLCATSPAIAADLPAPTSPVIETGLARSHPSPHAAQKLSNSVAIPNAVTQTAVPATPNAPAAVPTAAEHPTPGSFASTDAPEPYAAITRLVIPSIGIDTAVEVKGLDQDGVMQTPSTPNVVTWYDFSSPPAGPGNAVFSGHLDYAGYGPGVFWRLGELQPGDVMEVRHEDGTNLHYRVTSIRPFSATDDATGVVAATGRPTITLITCDGAFDRNERAYDQRLVVTGDRIDPFVDTWMRTDRAVNDLVVSRSWVWGPQSAAFTTTEPYAEAPDGKREVVYFDKARMEDNRYRQPDSPWYVTTGLLVVELMLGRMQVGDNTFNQRAASGQYVAGDPVQNSGISYELFAAARGQQPFAAGETNTTRIARLEGASGQPAFLAAAQDPALAAYGITAGEYVPETNHRVASVFWGFMNATGTIWEDNGYSVDFLFENPYYATGYPITEAYWTSVAVAGSVHDVLMQCFERRCLTYTPSNAVEWQVEMGNVGQHYYTWRYGHGIPGSETGATYLPALGDNMSGSAINWT